VSVVPALRGISFKADMQSGGFILLSFIRPKITYAAVVWWPPEWMKTANNTWSLTCLHKSGLGSHSWLNAIDQLCQCVSKKPDCYSKYHQVITFTLCL